MNLMIDPWIPVRHEDGAESRVTPWEITRDIELPGRRIVALAAPRADFNGALIQLLIGLFQTACPPQNEPDWLKWVRKPPAPDALRAALEPYLPAFELGGEGARFMQDLELTAADGEPVDVSALLIESPGQNTIKLNTDLFVKRGQVGWMCLPCAAAALFTLQTNAPSGGAGHRTSLRGGGPLTTVALGDTLWHTVWFNVLLAGVIEDKADGGVKRSHEAIFPWLGPTRTSEKKGSQTTLQHVHPLQVYWAMPRRIRLILETRSAPCDLCDVSVEEGVSSYVTRNYGFDYKGGWRHPLSPYRRNKPEEEPTALKGNPGCLFYRHYLSYTQGNPDDGIEPARCIDTLRKLPEISRRWDERLGKDIQPQAWVFGYDMDNMKARCWYEGILPVVYLEREQRSLFERVVGRLVAAAEKVAANTRTAVKVALYGMGSDKDVLQPFFAAVVDRFWQDTEAGFYGTVRALRELVARGHVLEDERGSEALKQEWTRQLRRVSEMLFDSYCALDSVELTDPQRAVEAFRLLRGANSDTALAELLKLPGAGDRATKKQRAAAGGRGAKRTRGKE